MMKHFQLHTCDLNVTRLPIPSPKNIIVTNNDEQMQQSSSSLKKKKVVAEYPWIISDTKLVEASHSSLFSHSPTKFCLQQEEYKINTLPPNFDTFNPFNQPSPIKLLDLERENTPPRKNTQFSSSSSLLTSQPSSSSSISKQSKAIFKKFYAKLREIEKSSVDNSLDVALRFAITQLPSLPNDIHGKVCMEIADLCKRLDRFDEAKTWYNGVHMLNPNNVQGWIEHSKLELEIGHGREAKLLLLTGLQYCMNNETLLLKYLQIEESMGDLSMARYILSKLRNVEPETVWHVLLGGAQLESRHGNDDVAIKVYAYLMDTVPQFGAIFHDAIEFYERRQRFNECEKILKASFNIHHHHKSYAPLLFTNIRLSIANVVKKPPHFNWITVENALKFAKANISRDQLYKVYMKEAHVHEMKGDYDMSRTSYKASLESCLKNLRWRIWLSGARLEMRLKRYNIARQLLKHSLEEVNNRMISRVSILIEAVRLEDLNNNVELAHQILRQNCEDDDMNPKVTTEKHLWKLYLERILLCVRNNDHERALRFAQISVKKFPTAGRLYAMLIQLENCHNKQLQLFRHALEHVPKSGEVWLEGARLHMNPKSKFYNLKQARKFIAMAIKYTPQFGDSFVEYIRLSMIEDLTYGDDDDDAPWNKQDVEQQVITHDPNYGTLWTLCREIHRYKSHSKHRKWNKHTPVAVSCVKIAAKLVVKEVIQMIQHHLKLYRHMYTNPMLHQKDSSSESWWKWAPYTTTNNDCDIFKYFTLFSGDLDGSVKLIS